MAASGKDTAGAHNMKDGRSNNEYNQLPNKAQTSVSECGAEAAVLEEPVVGIRDT